MKQSKPKTLFSFIIAVLAPLAVGALASLLVPPFAETYAFLPKPPLAPPAAVFPIVWTALYILMGVSSWLVWRTGKPGVLPALTVYFVQLLMNFLWVLVFFGALKLLSAFIWLLGLIAVIALMIKRFYPLSRIAALLQIPYLLWSAFAAYLNLAIFILSR